MEPFIPRLATGKTSLSCSHEGELAEMASAFVAGKCRFSIISPAKRGKPQTAGGCSCQGGKG
jgi:hypothetical protein